MSLDQFFITFIIALLIGVALSNLAKTILENIVIFYRKLTFRHVLLTPYTPKNKKKDTK